MPDHAALMADWEALLARRSALAEPLRFWTAILEGWVEWKPPAVLRPLLLSPDECRQRWQAGHTLLPPPLRRFPPPRWRICWAR